MSTPLIKTIENDINRIKASIEQVKRLDIFTTWDKKTLVPFYKKRLRQRREDRERALREISVSSPILVEAHRNTVSASGIVKHEPTATQNPRN